jgi:hypothetical protein
MLEILLLGVVHDYQRQRPFQIEAYVELGAHQRASYIAWMWKSIKDFHPQIIFDEMNLSEGDYKFEETSVPWVYMDIPEHVRLKFLSVERNDQELRAEVDEPREEYWLSLIEQMSHACDVSKIIIICGAAHLDSFGARLRLKGHHVSVVDIRNEDWFEPRWILGYPGTS